jgi:tetratricopeptide (TPR) repeat protein
MTRFQLGRLPEAIETMQAALTLNARFAPAWSNLGIIQAAAGQPQAALDSFERAAALGPASPELLVNKGNALVALRRARESRTCFDQALASRPGMMEALIGRASMHREMGDHAAALADSETVLAIQPDNRQALCERGNALTDLGRFADSMASFNAALGISPTFAEAAFGKATLLLLHGDFAQGLPLYEARKHLKPPSGVRPYPQPLWRREPLMGKRLFLYFEQGLGDTIMFSRFVGPLAATGAAVSIAVPECLHALFRGFLPRAEIISGDAAPAAFDYHAALGSLPLLLGAQLENIAALQHHLTPDGARVEHWRRHIGESGLRIGIAWQGARNRMDVGRSFPVSLFAPLAAIPGVRLISLQKNDGTEQLESLPPGMQVERLGPDFDSGPGAFVDSAAVMASLDLVISSDTALAHLASALGRPAWIALRHIPDWRWLLGRNDSPWCPGAVLFRQPAPGDWTSVFTDMAVRLRERAGAR